MTAAIVNSRDKGFRVAVCAAGGLVIRRGPDNAIRVVLVHCPGNDDWSFTSTAAAVPSWCGSG